MLDLLNLDLLDMSRNSYGRPRQLRERAMIMMEMMRHVASFKNDGRGEI